MRCPAGLTGLTVAPVLHRRHLMEPLAGASCFPGGCRMIAFDRPPFGLTERPLQWEGGDANNPYTPEVWFYLMLPSASPTYFEARNQHPLSWWWF